MSALVWLCPSFVFTCICVHKTNNIDPASHPLPPAPFREGQHGKAREFTLQHCTACSRNGICCCYFLKNRRSHWVNVKQLLRHKDIISSHMTAASTRQQDNQHYILPPAAPNRWQLSCTESGWTQGKLHSSLLHWCPGVSRAVTFFGL